MNVMIRDKGAKLLTHVTGNRSRSRFYKPALFFLVVVLVIIIVRWTSSEQIGEPDVILSPEIISLNPEGSDDTFLPVLPPTLAAAQKGNSLTINPGSP